MPSYPTDPETWLKLPYSYRAVHARQVRWYPGDSYHTLPSSLIDKGDVSLAHAQGDTLDGFMAALPQWDLPVVAGDPSSLPWRLIWTWHPVLEAFGHNKNANSQYTPDPWFYPAELFDNQKEVYKLLPAEIENYQDHVIVYPLYRLIVFHHTSKPRNKMINLLTSKLALPGIQNFFSPSKIASLVILSPLFQTGLTIPALANSMMLSSSYLSNVPLMTLHPGSPMPKLTTLSFRIVPSLLRNLTKPPHLPPLLTFPLSLIPLPLSPQPNLLWLPKRVASLLKPLKHSVPLSRCALHRRCLLHHPLLLLLYLLRLLLRPLLLPLYPLRSPKTPNFPLSHFSLPPPQHPPLLKG